MGNELAYSIKELFLSQIKSTIDLLKDTEKLGAKPAINTLMEVRKTISLEEG